MSNYPMPAFDPETLKGKVTDEDLAVIRLIVARGTIRAAAPKVPYDVVERTNTYEYEGVTRSYTGQYRQHHLQPAQAFMVWRHVVFSVSRNPKHQCIPCTDDLYLPIENHDERRAEAKRLIALADVVISAIPKTEWHGVQRWGRALGYL